MRCFFDALNVHTRKLRDFCRRYRRLLRQTISVIDEPDYVIRKEAIDFIDPECRGLAAAIGFRKGQFLGEFLDGAKKKKSIRYGPISVGVIETRTLVR